MLWCPLSHDRRFRRGGLLIGALAGLVLAAPGGCAREAAGQARAAAPLQIVATTGMVADVVRAVAGDRADVKGLIGAGVDPHLYKPTRNDIAALLAADAIFYSGLHLEGKMSTALHKIASSGRPVFAVTERIPPAFLLYPDGPGGHPDPHVWMDVAAWAQTVDVVAAALAGLDPAHADEYRARAVAYSATLTALDDYVRTVCASIPRAQRLLVTAHDAFNYFGRAYDVQVLGVQGLSTESEAGLDDINQLVRLLVQQRVGAVFVETSVADRNVRALVEGAAAHGHTVRIGASLFSDAMGSAGTYEGTYMGMIDHNATAVARALGGDAPARGLHGRLAANEEQP
jgi:manganese/zinc/iron transport system substrate-binding protein